MADHKKITRKEFIAGTTALLVSANRGVNGTTPATISREPIIDIHQHIHYHQRTDEHLLHHQRAMGVTKTILLPSGRPVNAASTHNGFSNGLQAETGGNAECHVFAQNYSKEFKFGANEVPDMRDALYEIEKYLKKGAVVIGELKFGVECDSLEMQKIYQLAQAYHVPVLMHWQHKMYNFGFERFYKMLEKYPKVNYIGHAQTWWANIDKNHKDQSVLYPKGRVTPGGLTDRYLSDYPNMFGDLSAGSGLGALTRDEDQAKKFLEKHQDKLIFGSDCEDTHGLASAGCSGARDIAEIRKLSTSKKVERKLLYENARKLFKL
ncbi:MAG: amidohydrolase family protein [Chitinophagaceae bacterium]